MRTKEAALRDMYLRWEQEGVTPYFPVIESHAGNTVSTPEYRSLLMFASCDYLGMSHAPELRDAAIEAIRTYGITTYGSPVMCGYTRLHSDAEAKLKELSSLPSAVLFPSCYVANQALITTLATKEDVIINDRTAHVSIFMGSQLSGAEVRTFRHNDMTRLEQILQQSAQRRRRIIIVDGLYSADGDFALLDEITALAGRYDARVVVDEAHSFGAVGPRGLGVADHFGVLDKVEAIVGTMSKALGSSGGFVLSNGRLEKDLRYMSSAYTSTHGPTPGVVAAFNAALTILEKSGGELRRRLAANVSMVVSRLKAADIDVMQTRSHVVPVLIRDEDTTIEVTNWLIRRGILVAAFLYPHVPANEGRLRIGLSSAHTTGECEALVDALVEAKSKFGF
jgi:7-keto-8-aminopelargonate synthetase-like enzyme